MITINQLRIALTVFFQLFAFGLLAQQRAIEGKILSAESNRPVANATIVLENGGAATTSDERGNFTLTVDTAGALLTISSVGFENKTVHLAFPLPNPFIIHLVEGNNMLQEVMVSTGYQEIPKDRQTGSFSKIGNKVLNEQISTNILERLEAVANGLAFDRTTSSAGRLMIRGLSSINGPRDPLIVVDNFPYDGDISNINPNDVQDITILRDAAAASIWGAKAGNGVIVITTKKGKLNTPLSIDITTNVTVENKPDLYYLNPISTGDFIDVEQFLFQNGYYNNQVDARNRPVLSPVVEMLLKMEDAPAAEQAALKAEIDRLRSVDVRDEFLRQVYSRGFNQQYALAMSGGRENSAWRLSAGYDRNKSVLEAVHDRLNLGLSHLFKPTDNLTVSTAFYYTNKRDHNGRMGYGQVSSKNSNLYPYARLYDEQGQALPIAKDYGIGFIDTLGGGRLLDWKYYPGSDDAHIDQTVAVNDLLLDFGVRHQLPAGFGIDLKYKFERQFTNDRNLRGLGSYYTRSMINNYTQLSESPFYAIPIGGIYDLQDTELTAHNARGQLNFDRTWARHALTAIVGGEVRLAKTDNRNNTFYGYDANTLTFGHVNYTVPYPTLVTGSSSFIPNSINLNRADTRFVSLYGNAAYTFSDRYTATVSARRDASNLFGLKTNDKWNPLWSMGVSWNVSNEEFWHSKVIDFLKIRATYGFSGNIDPAQTALTTIRYGSLSPFVLEPTARFDNYANPELRWETVRMINAGVDFGLWDSRVSGSIEFYRKDGKNLFGSYPIDYTTGIGMEVTRNVASIKGSGVDIELNSLNTKGAVRWQTNLNFSYNRDRVVDYYLSSRVGSRFMLGSATVSGIAGHPVYSVYSYKWAGLDPTTGDPLGYDAAGRPTNNYNALTGPNVLVDSLNHHGSALPLLFGSMGNTFTWKNVSLTARIQYKMNYSFRRQSINYSVLFSSWDGHADFANRWMEPGDELTTEVPSMAYPAITNRDAFYRFSEVLVERGDYVRLQYVALSYTLGNRLAEELRLNSLSLQLNINNVGILWRANKKGIDPEYQSSGFSMPPSRTISLGLRANL
ncbi:SusC/RagA family TonB-linked outer membrane protein [Parapedobacter deserti]|uniref:SusC/RagA family TonB-linked outer membrane protein n=1 Tax=Parapedobacter deserti TaxID=1912957 RepID=A0ABV7JRP3_9SPHI